VDDAPLVSMGKSVGDLCAVADDLSVGRLSGGMIALSDVRQRIPWK